MKTITTEEARELAEKYPLEKFAGTTHELPVEGTEDAYIYVTGSEDTSLIGQEVRASIEEERYALHATAQGMVGNPVVRGPAAITETGIVQRVMFPLDEGWGWGDLVTIEKEATYVRVRGGVGIRVPLDESDNPTPFQAKVRRAYRAPNGVPMPPFGVTEEELQRIETQARLINAEREIQDKLYRAMVANLADDADDLEMPEFKFIPTWWVETSLTLVHLAGFTEGKVPQAVTEVAKENTTTTREAVTFKMEFPAKRELSATPHGAKRSAKEWASTNATLDAPSPSYVIHAYTPDAIYGGIR